jgi:cation diffusion facilitator family transporter
MTQQQRTALFSVFAALALVALKLVTGLLTGSLGLLAEAAHSGTDLVAALLTFFALGVAGRPADREHPYGHGKAEHLAALGEASFLVLVSVLVAVQAAVRLASPNTHHVDATWWVFAVVGVVLAVDLMRATASWRASRRLHSAALGANALHFASDFVGSLAVLVGLIFVNAGVPAADPIAALVVAVLVVIAAARLMRQNVDVLMDRSSPAAESVARASIASAVPRAELRRLRMREAAGRHFIDATIAVAPDAAAVQGHAVADAVEDAIASALPDSDVTVHIELRESADPRERATGAAQSVRGVREVHNVRVVSVDGETDLSLHAKLPAGLPLTYAHVAADKIEAAVRRAVPEVRRVDVHLEPLAASSLDGRPATAAESEKHREDIARAVRTVTGEDPHEMHLHVEDRGLVVALTIGLPADGSLQDAHDAAGSIEELIRAEHPDIAEVLVHTEPAADRPERASG